MQLDAYLFFNGQCEEAFNFYSRCMGAKIIFMMTNEGSPAAAHTPPQWQKKILHARMEIGGDVLLGSDGMADHHDKPQGFSMSLNLKGVSEAERIFGELAEGGKIKMAMTQTFFAYRFGMLEDRFGIPWMIICENAE